MDRQQPVKINLESALNGYYDSHDDTLKLRLAFNFYNDHGLTQVMEFLPGILQKVPANPALFQFNSDEMRYVKRPKDLKHSAEWLAKLDPKCEYLILWPKKWVPNIKDSESDQIRINMFIQEMQNYNVRMIYREIEYMFLIRKGQVDALTKKEKDMRLYLHHGDFGEFIRLFRKGSVLENEPDTDSEYGFPVWSNSPT